MFDGVRPCPGVKLLPGVLEYDEASEDEPQLTAVFRIGCFRLPGIGIEADIVGGSERSGW